MANQISGVSCQREGLSLAHPEKALRGRAIEGEISFLLGEQSIRY